MTHILLVEDDKSIVTNLTEFLQKEGFSITSVDGQRKALALLEQSASDFDLMLLDVSLAEGNGFSICRAAKATTSLPVIFLTASGDEYSVVTGLDLGADDYISKPFRPRELISRINNILRRYGKANTLLEYRNLSVDIVRGTVRKDGQEILLSALEYRLLLYFLNNQGIILSRSRLLEALWDIAGEFVNDNTLTASNLILSLLREPELSVLRRQQLLQELTQLLSRIDWLVESLLKISKMDAGTIQMQQTPVSVPELIQHAAEPLLIPMELREQTLTIHNNSRPQHIREAPQFLGDPACSTEAVLNILKNCMEHTPAGGNIQVSFSGNAIFTEIVIEDNGPGFSKEDLPHLFERFYKGKNSSEHSVGIGLALARMIVSRQNGTLKAENRPQGGARFILKFYHGTS